MKDVVKIADLIYAMRVGSDQIGVALRETGYITFTGSSISHVMPDPEYDESGQQIYPDYDEIIKRRMLEFIKDRIYKFIETHDCITAFAMPSYFPYTIFLQVIEELGLVKRKGIVIEEEGKKTEHWDICIRNVCFYVDVEPKKLWEGCPNSGYTGNTWVLWEC